MGKDGRTVLHVAAERGLVDICQAILARPNFTEVTEAPEAQRRVLEYAPPEPHYVATPGKDYLKSL